MLQIPQGPFINYVREKTHVVKFLEPPPKKQLKFYNTPPLCPIFFWRVMQFAKLEDYKEIMDIVLFCTKITISTFYNTKHFTIL